METPARLFRPIDFKTRFPALDGIRALAVTAVFAVHYGIGTHGNLLVRILKLLNRFGGFGVDLFFVLSGFLITGILYDTRSDSRFFYRFFARRSLRIFPVFYLTAAILLLLTPVLGLQWRPLQATFLLYVGNFFANHDQTLYVVLSARHPAASVTLAHLWSLCVEEQFYVLWPVAVWLIRDRIKLIWTAAGLSLLALVLRCTLMFHAPGQVEWVYRTLPFRIDTLLFGAILALLLRGPAANHVQRGCTWLFLIAGAFFIGNLSFHPDLNSVPISTFGLTLDAATFTGLIGMTLRTGSPAFRFFHLRPLRFIGRYSYGFYVFHYLFSSAWIQFLIYLAVKTHKPGLSSVLAIVVNYCMTLLAAYLSYRLFEAKFLRFKTHFEYDSEIEQHKHAFTTG